MAQDDEFANLPNPQALFHALANTDTGDLPQDTPESLRVAGITLRPHALRWQPLLPSQERVATPVCARCRQRQTFSAPGELHVSTGAYFCPECVNTTCQADRYGDIARNYLAQAREVSARLSSGAARFSDTPAQVIRLRRIGAYYTAAQLLALPPVWRRLRRDRDARVTVGACVLCRERFDGAEDVVVHTATLLPFHASDVEGEECRPAAHGAPLVERWLNVYMTITDRLYSAAEQARLAEDLEEERDDAGDDEQASGVGPSATLARNYILVATEYRAFYSGIMSWVAARGRDGVNDVAIDAAITREMLAFERMRSTRYRLGERGPREAPRTAEQVRTTTRYSDPARQGDPGLPLAPGASEPVTAVDIEQAQEAYDLIRLLDPLSDTEVGRLRYYQWWREQQGDDLTALDTPLDVDHPFTIAQAEQYAVTLLDHDPETRDDDD